MLKVCVSLQKNEIGISVPDWKIEKFWLTEPDDSSSYFTLEVDRLLDETTDTFDM